MTNNRNARRIIAQLEDETRARLSAARRTPPLDPASLYDRLRADRPTAIAELAALNDGQRAHMAHALATHATHVTGNLVLASDMAAWIAAQIAAHSPIGE